MDWILLYDLTLEGFAEWPIALLGFLGWVGCGVYAFRRLQKRRFTPGQGFSFVFFGVMVVFGGVLPYYDYHRLTSMLRAGQTFQTEGAVTGYSTQEVKFHNSSNRSNRDYYVTYETFQVGPTRFAYYQRNDAQGFHNLGDDKISIREGMYLRVHYTTDNQGFADGPRILRLERRNATAR